LRTAAQIEVDRLTPLVEKAQALVASLEKQSERAGGRR
jgi:hypothetical protein